MENPRGTNREKGLYSVSELGGPSAANGRRIKVIGSQLFLDRRYQQIDVIGTGAYGIVVSAVDSITGERVAIKKMEKAFQHPTFAKRTLRQLKILRLLKHDNILSSKTIQLPNSLQNFNDIYVVSQLMQTDLSSIIKSPQRLSDQHCQFFLYQILRGLKYLHSAKILHRDLKPRNLLVNANCDLKICDFGLARPIIDELDVESLQMTDYVATRWYRPPELLLTYKKYKESMDLWSVGVIFGQLIARKPILPGNDANHQLEIIFNLIGTPSEEDILAVPQQRIREKLMRVLKRPPKNFSQVFRNTNPNALDLLKRMLTFNPEKRISIDQALLHPYLQSFHCPGDEPTVEPLSLFDFSYERNVVNQRELKNLLYEEILLYHFTDKQESYMKAKAEFHQQFS